MPIHGHVMARNTVINLIGLIIPLGVGFLTIPFVIKILGTQRFGVLSLVWVVFGYFGLFDLGLGRAITKFAAEALGRGEVHKLPGFLWTTIIVQAVIGGLAALAMILASPLLTHHVLKIPPELLRETALTIGLVAVSLPIMFITSSFRGLLEAGQRFDYVNIVKVPTNILFYLLPVIGALLGYKLPGIVILLVLSRFLALLAWAGLCFKVFPQTARRPEWHREHLGPLFSFSSWLALSSILATVTASLDRFVIGTVITLEAVAYYAAPYEAVSRVGVIPGSISMVIFPAFSTLDAHRSDEKTELLFLRSVKYVLMLTGPVFIFVAFMAKRILELWLGAEFALRSTAVLQLLCLGFLVNSLILIAFNYLQAVGRVDISTKLQFAEMVFQGALVLVGAKIWGIRGVAGASAIRLSLFTVIFFIAAFRIGRVKWAHVWKSGIRGPAGILILYASGLLAMATLKLGLFGALMWTVLLLLPGYYLLLNSQEKHLLRTFWAKWLRGAKPEDKPA